MTFYETIRGVEVTIHCEDFDGDESVGIPYGPETVYAIRDDGSEFELTDAEITDWAIAATQALLYDDPWW